MTRFSTTCRLRGARIARRDTAVRLGGDEFAVLCEDAEGSSPFRSGSPEPEFGARGRVFSCARRCRAGLQGDGFDDRNVRRRGDHLLHRESRGGKQVAELIHSPLPSPGVDQHQQIEPLAE